LACGQNLEPRPWVVRARLNMGMLPTVTSASFPNPRSFDWTLDCSSGLWHAYGH
jgi:hypothetical protein